MHITTTKGLMDTDLLVCKEGNVDNDCECTNWTEYWLGEELVHRSVHVRLKTAASVFAETADLA